MARKTSRTRRFFAKAFSPLTRMPFGIGGSMMRLLSSSGIVYENQVGDGTNNSVVMACIGWLQRNYPQMILQVEQQDSEGTWNPVPYGSAAGGGAGRMLSLLDKPNPYYHGVAMKKALVASLRSDGNAYLIVVRNKYGAPIQIWWHPHTMVEPKREMGSELFIDYYEVQTGTGAPLKLAPSEVIHFRDGIDPDNPMKGISPLKSALREVYTDDEAASYTASLMRNMGVPGVIVSPDASAISAGMAMSDSIDLEADKRKIEQAITGANRGRTIVMNGPTKVSTVGFNPQEMNLRELRKLPEERISAVLGVPAVVAGLGAGLDRSTFANMAEAREAAAEEGLLPLGVDIALTIQHQLLPMFEGDNATTMRVTHDLSQVRALREDDDKAADRWVRVVGGGLATVAEAREAINLPVDDSHKVFLRPLGSIEIPDGQTMSELDAAAAAAAPALPEGKTKAGRVLSQRNADQIAAALDALRRVLETAGVDLGTEDPKMRALVVANSEVKRLSRLQQAKLVQALERTARGLEKQFSVELEREFKSLGSHVSEIWSVEAQKNRKDDTPAPEYEATALRVLDLAALAKWKRDTLGSAYKRHYSRVAASTLETLSATIGLELGEKTDEVAVRVLRNYGKNLDLVDIEGQTKTALFQALADGKAEGEGVAALERRIRDYVTGGSRGSNVSARATRIARTETMNAQRVSTRTAYEQSGVYDMVLAFDDRVGYGDPDCVARNGEVFTMDQAEAEEAEEHPNGTLSWAPANSGDESISTGTSSEQESTLPPIVEPPKVPAIQNPSIQEAIDNYITMHGKPPSGAMIERFVRRHQ